MGCDWKIDSTAVEDSCGVCEGDGSGCKVVNETVNGNDGGNYDKF